MSEHDTRGKVAISPFLPEAADLPSEAVSLRSTRNRKLVARIAIYSESPPEKLLLQAGDTDGHQFDQQFLNEEPGHDGLAGTGVVSQ
jgi:hypothetical protein